MEKTIPKKIHLCWFGNGKMDETVRNCIKSWKEKLPDYEMKIWNEENFDINISKYTKDAYKAGKWAFVSDYVRLWILYNEGGIYLDSDVEIIKPLDKFLDDKVFFSFENKYTICTAVIGAEKKNKYIKSLLNYYNDKEFYGKNGKMDLTPNTKIITDILKKEGLKKNGESQVIKSDIHIYRQEYFSPKSYLTGKISSTTNTYAIHHFKGSWIKDDITTRVKKVVLKIIGEDSYLFLANEKNKIVDVLKR